MLKNKAVWRGLALLGVFVMLFGNTAGQVLEKNRNTDIVIISRKHPFPNVHISESPVHILVPVMVFFFPFSNFFLV